MTNHMTDVLYALWAVSTRLFLLVYFLVAPSNFYESRSLIILKAYFKQDPHAKTNTAYHK